MAHAVAPLTALLAFAGLGGLVVHGAHLRAPLLASLRVLGLRAVIAPLGRGLRRLLRALGEGEGGEDGEADGQHGSFHALLNARIHAPSTRRCNDLYQSCFSMVPASETSNLTGPSTLRPFTTPLSTTIEKRLMRVPMPRALRSSSRPSALVHCALPSARKRILPSAFWSRPQCAMTNASLTATHHTSLTPFFFSASMFCT